MTETPPSPPRSPWWLSLLGFLAAVAGIFLLALTHHLFCRNPLVVGVQALAVLLMIWARATFGVRSFHATANPTAGGLVTSGPYRWWRHPIYAAILYFTWAGAACHFDLLAAGGALLVTAGLAVRIAMEERLLIAAYPDYTTYAGRTRRVVPFVF